MKTSQTLAQRLTAGHLPVADALGVAAAIAEQLRRMHDQDRTHGALTPGAVVVTDSGAELQPAGEPGITPYSAPEVVQGQKPDPRSDIFSFGAVIYEMFTGRRAFDGAYPLDPAPPRSGSAALDRLVANCMAKLPDARFQQVQKIQLELRMLGSAARRGALDKMPQLMAAKPSPVLASVSVRGEIEALEARISARLQEQDRAVSNLECVANEILKALRTQQFAGPASACERPARGYAASQDYPSDAPSPRPDRAFELLSDKVSRIDMLAGTLLERLQKLEQKLDEFDTDAAALRDTVTRDIRNFERALKAQSTAIESARTAMGQTDDLVERVVEALDSLQSMLIPSAEERAAS